MRAVDVIALIALIVVSVLGRVTGWWGESTDERNPRRPSPSYPAPSVNQLPDATIRARSEEKRSSSGTAFSVDGRGIWLTARHVVDGCSRIYFDFEKKFFVAKVIAHANADVAVLLSYAGSPSLSIGEQTLRAAQNGFAFGFPKGKPGAIHAQLIGRLTLRSSGRFRTEEPGLAWSMARRVPEFSTGGGLSGGPVLNGAGSVIGIVQAGSVRRGRFYSAAPATIIETMTDSRVKPINSAGRDEHGGGKFRAQTALSRSDFPDYGLALRTNGAVTKVICRVW